MDNKIIDQAMAFVRKLMDKNHGEVPEWSKFQEQVKEHLKDPYNLKFKMPQEYYYAYLRGKGLTHEECQEKMGIVVRKTAKTNNKQSFWKFW
ncbi:hypothetical protein [Undibacterium fentianense]|uniref:Uncharacterized protein n=1 Tax=Undibacterium fentianense TaxID=2828728 RepID=A0A941IC36_9BURK|nr:hypothetical protein [Undibacterium fentianense]MBR7798453.1 hypothetical protein [Undibacterium fentianense]